MTLRPTVLLFDIDGTLITTGGAGRRAMDRAFQKRHGRKDACSFPLDGMTDRMIIRAGLEAVGAEPTPEEIDAVIKTYVEILEEEVRAADMRRYIVHPGMHEALDRALQDARFAVGLGTGNVREGARVKLSRVGIHDRFSFGGFGCDADARADLIRIGAERGAAKLGVPLTECRVVIIGDTPKDVAAAKAIGAETVGVGTGAYTAEQLIEVGAEAAFRDLLEAGAIERVLYGRS